MRVLLVNASHPSYNLGMEKAAQFWKHRGAEVMRASEATPIFKFDVVWISAIFSWHVPRLIQAVPIVQRRRPLDWMSGPLPCLHDWTEQKLIDFQRWGNRLAKGIPFCEYRRGLKDVAPTAQESLALGAM